MAMFSRIVSAPRVIRFPFRLSTRGLTSTSTSHAEQTDHSFTLGEKKEGNIAALFSSLGRAEDVLPERFSQLKKDLWNDKLPQSWDEVLSELAAKTEEVARLGNEVSGRTWLWIIEITTNHQREQVIPRVNYEDLRSGLSQEQKEQIKDAGVVIVRGAVPKEVRGRESGHRNGC